MTCPRPLGLDLGIAQALPIAETLFRQTFLDQRLFRRMASFNDGIRGLMGALQMTSYPKRAFRQLLGQAFEGFAVFGVGRHIRLAIKPAVMGGDRRMAYPPPTCRRKIA